MDEVDLADSDLEEGGMASADQHLVAVDREIAQVEAQIERLLARQAELQEERERLQHMCAAEARAPRADWQGAFAWDVRVQQLMGDVFGLRSFRPLQREVINATLQGRDVLCLMPSGGGKSLCYQLPALLGSSGLTLVVSPLLSLIQDQVLGLRELGVHAAALTSLTGREEAATISKRLENGDSGLRLLYCTPEKVANSKRFFAKLEKVYKAGRLHRVAIDEAHCCSQWGNDFRPDYKKLGILKQQFPGTPLIALTATATQTVCNDLCSILKIEGCESFKSSINRPNLYYEVKQKPAGAKELVLDIAGFIRGNYPAGESGIVYVLTRKDAESLAEELRGTGVSCQAYHADMEAAWRESVHLQWSQGKVQVIVATIAFGMGINNPHVRFVIHHTISKSVENYYQESGRAGRDGLPAHCRMYYRFGDYLRQAAVVTMESNWEPRIKGMLQYASAATCRRALLCRHFGEAPSHCAGMCNCCRRQGAAALAAAAAGAGPAAGTGGVLERKDVTEPAKGALRTLQGWPGAEKRATLIQLVDKWRGSKDTAVARAAKVLSRDENEAVVQALVLEGCLRLDFGFTAYSTNVYLMATPWAASLLQGKLQLFIAALPHPAGEDAAVKPQLGEASRFARERNQQLAQRGQQQREQQQQEHGGGTGPAAAAAVAAPQVAEHRAAAAEGSAARSVLERVRQRLATAFDTIPAAVLSDDQVTQLAVQRSASRQLVQLIGEQKADHYGPELLGGLQGQAPDGAPAQHQREQQLKQQEPEQQQRQQQQPAKKQQEQGPEKQKRRLQRPEAQVVVLDSSDEGREGEDDFVAPRPGPKRGRKV